MLSDRSISKLQLNQMIDASNITQAFKVLNEAGIGLDDSPENYEAALNKELAQTFEFVKSISNGLELFDIFRYGYDGLNIKIAIKAFKVGKDCSDIMNELGTVSKADIIHGFGMDSFPGLPEEMSKAALEARDALARTGDPQKVDIIIDRAVLKAMHRKAHEYDNAFLHKVIKSRIDVENIRCIVRSKRANKNLDFLKSVINEGGYIPEKDLFKAFYGDMGGVTAFIGKTMYGPALSRSFESLETGGRLTLFDKLCDNYLLSFIKEGFRVVFGVEPVLAYMLEKEIKIASVRMVMASLQANIPAYIITERMRNYA